MRNTKLLPHEKEVKWEDTVHCTLQFMKQWNFWGERLEGKKDCGTDGKEKERGKLERHFNSVIRHDTHCRKQVYILKYTGSEKYR